MRCERGDNISIGAGVSQLDRVVRVVWLVVVVVSLCRVCRSLNVFDEQNIQDESAKIHITAYGLETNSTTFLEKDAGGIKDIYSAHSHTLLPPLCLHQVPTEWSACLNHHGCLPGCHYMIIGKLSH